MFILFAFSPCISITLITPSIVFIYSPCLSLAIKISPGNWQQGNDYTMAPMLSKEMAKINWKERKSKEIKNLVRGLNPIMGAYTMYQDKKIKLWKVEIVKNCEIEQKDQLPRNFKN